MEPDAGIIRAIDVEKGVFYVITPVPIEQLQDVDTLLQGRIEIPVPLLMVRYLPCPQPPHLPFVIVFNDCLKSSKFI